MHSYVFRKIKIYRDIRIWWFNKKLSMVAKFIEKHKLYPVNLDNELLKVWKNDKTSS